MILRHLRAVAALIFLTLAVAVSAAPGVSQAATAASPSPSASPGAARTEISISLLEVPSSQAKDPRARDYIIDHLAPGTVIHRKFAVRNLGSAPAHLIVYPAAATISKGSFQFGAGHTQNTMTTWVSISRGALTLAPHSNATLVATVAVPGNAPSGEQYGVIWVQQAGSGAGNVTLVSRVGIRLYLSIGAGGAAAAGFTLGTPVASRTAAGAPTVRLPVHNTGGVSVDVHGVLQLSGGPGGVSAGPFNTAAIDTLAPGQSDPATFTLGSKLPNGPWQASFTMVSGLITMTEKVTLNFSGAPATAAAAHNSFPVVPVVAGLAALIVLVLIALLITRSRRTMRARRA